MKDLIRKAGRPPSSHAAAHDRILASVFTLLQTSSVRDLTFEAVAKEAGVGKPTLYKWWGSKSELVISALQKFVVPELEAATDEDIRKSLRSKASKLVEAFNGVFGRVIAELIAEGQSDPDLLKRLNTLYILPRRKESEDEIEAAKRLGIIAENVDANLVIDAIFGPIYFQLLTKLHVLTPEYSNALIDTVLTGILTPQKIPECLLQETNPDEATQAPGKLNNNGAEESVDSVTDAS